MSKKEAIAIIGSVVLFCILVLLFILEISNPTGGGALVNGIFG